MNTLTDIENASYISATEAKNQFSSVVDMAMQGKVVAVTRQNKVRAVVLSVEAYERLLNTQVDPLQELRTEFDELVSRMQKPKAAKAGHDLFAADSAALGKAARTASRKATRSKRG